MQNLLAIVLDDDEFMLDITQTVLSECGIGLIQTFTSASAALSELDNQNSRQVILLDLVMPDMDGIEFLRHLAHRQYLGAIIVFSGEDQRTLQTVENLGRAHRLRILGSLHKPFDRETLLKLLGQIATSDAQTQSSIEKLTVAELNEGLLNGALVPVFQPQVDAKTGRAVGVEALARWRHAVRGLLGPGTFIPVAEKTSLIIPLTKTMIVESMRQWSDWSSAGFALNLAVNISMDCLADIDFPDWLVTEAGRAGIPLERLVLEITESRVMQNATVSLDVMSRLCLKRIHLSIDDFGTAYSNMEKLQMLPFSELKIDRAFVHDATINPSSRAILESSATLGKRLDMRVVAEGVETADDWQTAVAFGCDLIQGFYVARPMPGGELLEWLRNGKWRNAVSNH